MPLVPLPLLAAVTPPTLKPAGPWIVRAEENLCLLERVYPVADQRVSLVFQPLLDLPAMEVFVVAGDDKARRQYSGSFEAGVEPGTRAYQGSYFSVVSPASKLRLTRLSTERVMLDELKDGDTLRIRTKPVDRSFAIVRPDKARAALATCVADLKKAWGIPSVDNAQTATMIEGNPGRYFSTDLYPAEALREGIYGRVIALLSVDAQGTVANCRILSSAGAALNAGTCKAAMRIRFKPARDANAKPLPSTFVLPVRWVLPGTE